MQQMGLVTRMGQDGNCQSTHLHLALCLWLATLRLSLNCQRQREQPTEWRAMTGSVNASKRTRNAKRSLQQQSQNECSVRNRHNIGYQQRFAFLSNVNPSIPSLFSIPCTDTDALSLLSTKYTIDLKLGSTDARLVFGDSAFFWLFVLVFVHSQERVLGHWPGAKVTTRAKAPVSMRVMTMCPRCHPRARRRHRQAVKCGPRERRTGWITIPSSRQVK